jgi:CHAD domain-containing protein
VAHAVNIFSETPSRTSSDHRDLEYWMNRTLAELRKLRTKPDADTVHDLRVALRRCRSVAAAVQEVDPHPDWQELRDCAKKLFRSLGDLRDTQVMEEWIKELQPQGDSLRQRLLATLAETEDAAQSRAVYRAERFDEKRWKELERSLAPRLRRIPADGAAAHCLALERLEEAKDLHRRAMRSENPGPWHALRIGVKKFRYTVESLLPALHEDWSDSLKRVQDALGNIHDLDVLKALVEKNSAAEHLSEKEDWIDRIERARRENLQDYRQTALGTASIWQRWAGGFPRQDWNAYASGRIQAMRKAMDPRPGRSLTVARLAKSLCVQLGKAGLCAACKEESFRHVLETAARLTGFRAYGKRKSQEKSARNFLLDSPLPPGWQAADWERVAWALRFQRGAEPGQANRRFLRLPAEQRVSVLLHAGILRLAIALRKAGATAGRNLTLETSVQGLRLRVQVAEDSLENARRVERAKTLLETSLGKTILTRLEPAIAEALAPSEAERGPQLVPVAR